MKPELLVAIGIFGLIIGSFLNVVIHRVPLGLSVATPPSACPACHHRIRTRHNIPVLGWVVLRGRCADCGEPVSIRYPLVELGTAIAFVAVAARLFAIHLAAAVPAFLAFSAIAIALSLIDLDVRRLPNVIVGPAYPLLALLLVEAAVFNHQWGSLVRAGIGAVILGGFYLIIVVAKPNAMGWGDVKLAGVVGGMLGYLSWAALVVGGFGAFVLGALVGSLVAIRGKSGRNTAVPFGPFMLTSAYAAIFVADSFSRFYFDRLYG